MDSVREELLRYQTVFKERLANEVYVLDPRLALLDSQTFFHWVILQDITPERIRFNEERALLAELDDLAHHVMATAQERLPPNTVSALLRERTLILVLAKWREAIIWHQLWQTCVLFTPILFNGMSAWILALFASLGFVGYGAAAIWRQHSPAALLDGQTWLRAMGNDQLMVVFFLVIFALAFRGAVVWIFHREARRFGRKVNEVITGSRAKFTFEKIQSCLLKLDPELAVTRLNRHFVRKLEMELVDISSNLDPGQPDFSWRPTSSRAQPGEQFNDSDLLPTTGIPTIGK